MKTPSNKKFIGLKKIIHDVLAKGIISYDYAYHLGEYYLHIYPTIIKIIQKRFRFVAVDEMQDMDSHQYNLLEKIFFENGNSISVFQRIGDKNQAIYNSVKADDVWIDRGEPLRLSGSPRLSKPIANVAKKFAIHNADKFDIVGMNDCNLKPHLLVFTSETINNLLPKFTEIVKSYKENGSITDNHNPIKVICWNTEWKETTEVKTDSKHRLVDYYSTFKKDKGKPKEEYTCIKSYLLYYDKSKKTLEPLRKNILNCLVKILYLENIHTEDGRYYTKRKVLLSIKQMNLTAYEELTHHLYNWSIAIIQGDIEKTWTEIRAYTPTFINLFSGNLTGLSSTFIDGDTSEIVIVHEHSPQITNYCNYNGVDVEITSVHAVKGQTHSATLYLESCYQGSHESQRLFSQFLGNNFADSRT